MDLIWDVAVKTAMVLALLYGVMWFIRRHYGKNGVVHRGPSILVVQSAQLGPGRSVHLIGVGGKMLLVGATSQQVSLLSELGAMDLESLAVPREGADSFERYLQQAVVMAGSLSAKLRGKGQDPADRGETGDGVGE